MNRQFLARALFVGLFAATVVAVSAPASAQTGALKGKVVDEAGKPVPQADLSFDYNGEYNFHFSAKTNDKGEFVQAGLYAVGGNWTITAKKGTLTGVARNLSITMKGVETIPDIVLRAGGPGPATAKEAEEMAKKNAEMKKLLADVDTAFNAKNYDVAETKLNEVLEKQPTCGACWVKLGDVGMKKNDLTAAEKAYVKATEVDAKSADAYDALASLYNTQKKFDLATKASEKATELHGAGGGGGDATSLFNAGVIMWNQSKMAEANAQFAKVIALNPTMAEAHYYLGMTFVNLGKVAEARKALDQYVKLAPTGPNADTAKAVLDSLPK